jgi:hypothetical protein
MYVRAHPLSAGASRYILFFSQTRKAMAAVGKVPTLAEKVTAVVAKFTTASEKVTATAGNLFPVVGNFFPAGKNYLCLLKKTNHASVLPRANKGGWRLIINYLILEKV